MQVSPGDDQEVHIASDTEVQNVIEFLSRSRFSPDNPHHEAGDGERGDRQDFPSDYAGSYLGELGMARDREVGVARDHMTRNERVPPHSDNSSSGSSGVGMEGPFRGGGHHALRSRSTSMSPVGVESERNAELKRSGLGSVDSGINLQPQPSTGHRPRGMPDMSSHDMDQRSYDLNRMSQEDEAELMQQEREMRIQKEMKRKSQEVSIPDFSKGFGPLIHVPSETHQPNDRFGMDMLRDSVEFKMGLEEFYKMSDSESEHSG